VVERDIDKLSVELSKACDLSAYLSSKLHDISTKDTLRNRIAGACFSVALDHFDAVLTLLGRDPKIYSSAFALTRLVFESYIRGMWFMNCATDVEVEDFLNGTFKLPKTPIMITAIEVAGNFDEKQLSVTYSNDWKHLCDYTHTGILQIQRWNKLDSVEPNYSDNEAIDVIRFTKAYALLAAVSFAEAVINNNELANGFLSKAKEMAQ
jgi:hypothetical protein